MGIAFDCRYGHLHLNADWVIWSRWTPRCVRPAGHPPITLLTNLANRVQPVIRYDLGDSVTMLPPGVDRQPASTDPAEGRRDEILYLESPVKG